MGRRKKNFIVVALKGEKLALQEFGEDIGAASDLLLGYDDGKALLFDGLIVPFHVRRQPSIVLGAAPAAAKKAPSSRKKKPSNNGAGGNRFDAETLEPAEAPAETTDPTPASDQQPDVEA